MRNTGIMYDSTEKTPAVLPEMEELLPPLTEEQSSALEADIVRNGCYSPIIVNQDMAVVDGHNRKKLCEKHGIPYKIAVFEFADLLEAKQWALETQKARRNLGTWELGKIALKLKPEVAAKARSHRGARTDLSTTLSTGSGHTHTRKVMADAVGIGEVTMGKVMKIDENAPKVVRDALDKKEISVNEAYRITRQLRDVPEEEREQRAWVSVEFAKAKDELRRGDAEIDRRTKIARLFINLMQACNKIHPTEENIGCWVDCAMMREQALRLAIDQTEEYSAMLADIAKVLRKFLAAGVGTSASTLLAGEKNPGEMNAPENNAKEENKSA